MADDYYLFIDDTAAVIPLSDKWKKQADHDIIGALEYVRRGRALLRLTKDWESIALLPPKQTLTLLLDFARWCALSVAHLWECPPIVREFLESGNESLRKEAHAAAEIEMAAYREGGPLRGPLFMVDARACVAAVMASKPTGYMARGAFYTKNNAYVATCMYAASFPFAREEVSAASFAAQEAKARELFAKALAGLSS